MSETTFLDGLEYCEVHGHKPKTKRDWYTIDIMGNTVRDEKCETCGKERTILFPRGGMIRLSETVYPTGEWR